MILVSHSAGTIKSICDSACTLDNGTLYEFDRIEDAFGFYEKAR